MASLNASSGVGGNNSSKYVGQGEGGNGACGCGLPLLRSYLYVFNFFLLIASLILSGLGLWSLLSEVWFIPLLGELSYPLSAYLLVGAGVVGLLAAAIGCCGSSRSDRCFLLIYVLLLTLVLILQVVAGGLAYFHRETAEDDLTSRLEGVFTQRYGIDLETTQAVDSLQREFSCCGTNFYDDWKRSEWMKEGLNGDNKVPDSCCKTELSGCGERDHPSNIFYSGCGRRLAERVRGHLGYLTVGGLGLCLLQPFGILFALAIYIQLGKDADADPQHHL